LFVQSHSSLHSFTHKQIDLKNSLTISQSQFIEPPSSENAGQDVRSRHSLHAFPSPSTCKFAGDHRPARTTRCRKENRAVPTAAFIMPAKPIDIGGQSRWLQVPNPLTLKAKVNGFARSRRSRTAAIYRTVP